MLYTFDSTYFKDVQARLANITEIGPGYLHLPADVSADYLRQFTSEHKITVRPRGKHGGRVGRAGKVWIPKSEHTPNHFWDCAVLNCVAADEELLGLRHLPDPAAPPTARHGRRVGRMTGFRD